VLAEEAAWVRERSESLDLHFGATVVDVGSSTRWFRTVFQPYIESEVFGPLIERGVDIIHLDAKADEGVDVVADVVAGDALPVRVIGAAELTLCTSLLEHVRDRVAVIRSLHSMTAPGGHLIVTVPHRYPYHPDPIDTGFRPSPLRLAREISSCFKVQSASLIDTVPRSSEAEDGPGWAAALRAPRLVRFKFGGNRMPARVLVSGVVARRER
jgi:SAM-dependent methyltransferase